MFHFILLVVGITLVVVSSVYFIRRVDFIADALDRYDWYISARDISLAGPAGVTFNLSVAKNDRLAAWRIYSQLSTRVAAVDFNESYDSATKVHESLYDLFGIVREEIANVPVERIQKDKADDTVKFYMAILNDGLRPHLSKWHIPLSKWVENESKKHPEQSVLEIERRFPDRKELVESFKEMNARMKKYSFELLQIVKAK